MQIALFFKREKKTISFHLCSTLTFTDQGALYKNDEGQLKSHDPTNFQLRNFQTNIYIHKFDGFINMITCKMLKLKA